MSSRESIRRLPGVMIHRARIAFAHLSHEGNHSCCPGNRSKNSDLLNRTKEDEELKDRDGKTDGNATQTVHMTGN
jgi:hypothetical protein